MVPWLRPFGLLLLCLCLAVRCHVQNLCMVGTGSNNQKMHSFALPCNNKMLGGLETSVCFVTRNSRERGKQRERERERERDRQRERERERGKARDGETDTERERDRDRERERNIERIEREREGRGCEPLRFSQHHICRKQDHTTRCLQGFITCLKRRA